jgi:hypothetical protein
LNGEIKRNNNFYKRVKKIKNQNNKNQIEKYNTINLMKSQTNKTFTKEPRQEIRNSKNENKIGEYNVW